MPDIDLKTATPDTSLPSTGFLFGADSQSAASPSVYSTQTVATALLGSTTLTGATVTTSSPVLDLAQTWNAGATTFTAIKMNVTDTASAAGSLLMDLQVGGSSKAAIGKDGSLTLVGASSTYGLIRSNTQFRTAAVAIGFNMNGNAGTAFADYSVGSIYAGASAVGFSVTSSLAYQWTSGTLAQPPDLFLTRRAAANLRLGAADAAGSSIAISSVDTTAETITLASAHGLTTGAAVQFVTTGSLPGGITAGRTYYVRVINTTTFEIYLLLENAIASSGTTGRVDLTSSGSNSSCQISTPFQSLSAQSFTGTNIPGQPFVITGSQGTGTGAGGAIVLQTAPAGSTGSSQNALAPALTINGDRSILISSAGTGDAPSLYWNALPGVFGNYGFFSPGVAAIGVGFGPGNGERVRFSSAGLQADRVYVGGTMGSGDTVLERDAANTLALRNGANAQAFRVYNTTDGTNLERGFMRWSSNVLQIGTEKAGTGTARTLEFQTDGTTRLTIATSGTASFSGLISLESTQQVLWLTRGDIGFTADGVLRLRNNAATGFDRLQFGGTTSSFPALKRSSTTLQARLADDSAFASVQGKLTTDTAYTAGDPTTTGYLILFDSNGTAYKVPAVAL